MSRAFRSFCSGPPQNHLSVPNPPRYLSVNMNDTPNTGTPQHGWTIQRIRDLTQVKFGKRACWYQVKTALALYEGKDVVGCAPTGAGKTMSFWIPLLMALEDGQDKISVVVTPLNLLGKQNVRVLEEGGLLTCFPYSLSFLSSPTLFVVDIWVCLQELTE